MNDQVIFLFTNPSSQLVTNLLVAHVLVCESWLSNGTLYLDIGRLGMFDISKMICTRTGEAVSLQRWLFKVCKRCVRRNKTCKHNQKFMSYKNIPMVMKERSQCRSLGHVMLRENEVQEEEETLGGCAGADACFPLPPEDLLPLT